MTTTLSSQTRRRPDPPDPPWLVEINAALALAVADIDPADVTLGYARISQDEKGEAESIETQVENEVGHARRHGLHLGRIFCDNDQSGKLANRPALTKLLAAIDNGPAKRILSRDTSRLTRNRRLGMDLMDRGEFEGVRFLFMDETELDLTTPSGREDWTGRVNKAAGRVEADTALMRDRMKRNAAKGRRQGGSRQFGYGVVAGVHPITKKEIVDKNAIRDDELALLLEARDRVLNLETQTALVEDWNRRGLTTSTGAQWHVGKFSHILLLESYVIYDLGEHDNPETGMRCECLKNPPTGAIRVHEPTGTKHRAEWPGIFTRAEQDAMRVALNSHSRVKDSARPRRPRQRNGEYWLTGLAECGGTWPDGTELAGQYCGGWMVGSQLEREHKTRNTIERRHMCRAKDSKKARIGCGKVFRNADALEMFVAEQVIAAFENPKILAWLDRGNDNAAKIVSLQRQIETTEGHLDSETDKRTAAMISGATDDDLRVFERTIATLKQALKNMRTEQDSLRSEQAKVVLADIGKAGIRAAWAKKGTRWRHDTAARLIEKVIVRPTQVHVAGAVVQDGNAWRVPAQAVTDQFGVAWPATNAVEHDDGNAWRVPANKWLNRYGNIPISLWFDQNGKKYRFDPRRVEIVWRDSISSLVAEG